MKTQPELTEAQLEALQALKAKHGQRWRAALRSIWQQGKDDSSPPLRQIRNNLADKLDQIRI